VGEESVGPAYCICKQEGLKKEREPLIADSAPGSVFNSCTGNENQFCVRESEKIEGKSLKSKNRRIKKSN